MNPATGPASTSFKVSAAGFIAGIGTLITSYVQNTNGQATNAHAIAGAGLAILSVLGKLAHDHGLNKATIAAAGSEVAAQLPALKTDLQKSVAFVENDLPGLKPLIDGVTSRVSALESKIPDRTEIESIIRTVFGQVFAPAVSVATPTPAATPPPVAPPA